jgi:vacuolar-type H+-ATPase subunit E/Vma4
MVDSLKDVDDIVAGILADADAEAARLVAEAQAYADAQAARAQDQAALIAREAAAKADAQREAIEADARAKAQQERRRRSLQLQESLERDILAMVRRRLAAMMREPGYRAVLRAWIAEAALGLSVDAAAVNASMDELPLIDEELLRQAEADAFAASGKRTALRKIEGDPLTSQGVSLTAEGGKLAYDNRVLTRMERNRGEIRRLIYDALRNEENV